MSPLVSEAARLADNFDEIRAAARHLEKLLAAEAAHLESRSFDLAMGDLVLGSLVRDKPIDPYQWQADVNDTREALARLAAHLPTASNTGAQDAVDELLRDTVPAGEVAAAFKLADVGTLYRRRGRRALPWWRRSTRTRSR